MFYSAKFISPTTGDLVCIAYQAYAAYTLHRLDLRELVRMHEDKNKGPLTADEATVIIGGTLVKREHQC